MWAPHDDIVDRNKVTQAGCGITQIISFEKQTKTYFHAVAVFCINFL